MAQAIRHGQSISSVPYGFDRNGRRIRRVRRVRDDRLRHCFAYPLLDGPGILLLFCLPPFLAVMALPVIDLMVHFQPSNALSPVTVLIVPFTLPLVTTFALTIGYLMIFFGRMLAASAIGDEDHPRFPIWNRLEILEELARWTWAGLTGLAIGALPAACFWDRAGDLDATGWAFFGLLVILGAAYAQMALMAALFHESLAAANPVTVFAAIARLGRAYASPCLVTAACLLVGGAAWALVLYRSPGSAWGVVGLWACWLLTLYLVMALCRMLGLLYARHARVLNWFATGDGG